MSNSRDAPGQLRMGYDAKELDELHKLAAKIERHYRERGARPGTLKTLRRVFRILESRSVRTFAELADETLDPRFVAWTASEGLADSTRDMLRGHLHAIIRRAGGWGLLPCQPTLPSRVKPGGRQWRLEHPPSTRTRCPSPDVVLRVLDYFSARSDKWTGWRSYAFLATIAKIRLPIWSALRLLKDDIDLFGFPTPMIRFRPRGGKERCMPIPADVWAILSKWIPENRSDRWVFPGPTKDAPWRLRSSHTATPASVLKAACGTLGIEPPLTLEQLRGSLVSPRFEATSTTPPLDNTPPASAYQELYQAVPTDPPASAHQERDQAPPDLTRLPADDDSHKNVTPPELPVLVTLNQVAAWVNRTPHALRHYRKQGMPKPFIHGTKGKPNEYLWSEMRSWLEKVFGRRLPGFEMLRFHENRG